MTTLVLSDYLADQSCPRSETVFDKPTIDESGKWVHRLYARTRDENGWHDRPLLVAADLTPNASKDNRHE